MYHGKFSVKARSAPEDTLRDQNEDLNLEDLPFAEVRSEKVFHDRDEENSREDSCQDEEKPERKKESEKKHRWAGTLIFYLLVIGVAAAGYFLTQMKIQSLTGELEIYEKAQHQTVCRQVFAELFGDPDWASLYEASGEEDTEFEGKDAYAAYMEAKVGDGQLTFRELPAEAEDIRSYAVTLEDEVIAQFTMKDVSGGAQVPQWQAEDVQVFFERNLTYRIRTQSGNTVIVNGVALGEDRMIENSYSQLQVGDGEPSKFMGQCIFEADNLLVQPTVTVQDSQGQDLEVTFDSESNTFSTPVTEQKAAEITQERQDLAFDAVEVYCTYMANKAGRNALGRYFKTGTSTYRFITAADLMWVQKDSGHSFANQKVTNYAQLSDSEYVVRVSMTFQLKRSDGSMKESAIDETLFFEKQDSGKWLVTEMTAVDVFKSRDVTQVRLTFCADGQILSSELYDRDAEEILCPVVSAPEGKVFSGWMIRREDENGNAYMQRVLAPNESGKVILPPGSRLEPMKLYPVYENA